MEDMLVNTQWFYEKTTYLTSMNFKFRGFQLINKIHNKLYSTDIDENIKINKIKHQKTNYLSSLNGYTIEFYCTL